jgi:hypothetical protein
MSLDELLWLFPLFGKFDTLRMALKVRHLSHANKKY